MSAAQPLHAAAPPAPAADDHGRWSWVPDLPYNIADQIIPEPNSGCWLWTGYVHRTSGYGYVRRAPGSNQFVTAHRLVYLLLRNQGGVLPSSVHVHHEICENKLCCNPDHLIAKSASAHVSDHLRKNALERRGQHSPAAHRAAAIEKTVRAAGVYARKNGKWWARLRKKSLGLFNDRESAVAARKTAVDAWLAQERVA